MKKLLNFVGTLIVMSTIFVNALFAQQTRMGSGMFNTTVQYQTNIETVKYNFYNALFGTINQAKRMFRTLDQISCDEIIRITENEMSNQMGETFDPGYPENYSVTYEVADGSFWDNWEDSYLIDGLDKQLHWGDPRTFALNRNHPDKQYLIATVTNKTTGAFFKCRANCGNVLRPVRRQTQTTVYQQPVPVASQPQYIMAPTIVNAVCSIKSFVSNPDAIRPGQPATLIWNTTCPTVNISAVGEPGNIGTSLLGSGNLTVYPKRTTSYVMSCDGGNASATVTVLGLERKGHTLRTVAIIVGAAALLVGGYFLFKGHGASPGNSGNIRDTNWQDGSTSPWPAGSGGSGPGTGPKF